MTFGDSIPQTARGSDHFHSTYLCSLLRNMSPCSTAAMIPSAVKRVVALPLLVLLHLVFSLFSLVLRITQSVSKTGAVIRQVSAPRHVALSLPSSSHRRAGRAREKLSVTLRERRALLETLKRTVRWAGEDGVKELSVYTDLGRFDSFEPAFGKLTSRL